MELVRLFSPARESVWVDSRRCLDFNEHYDR
jgi:hypothetical protein